MTKLWRRALRPALLALTVLFLAAVALVLYPVLSFDTETLPARYGAVDVVAYPVHGRPKPLLIGFGGAEGGNSWAREAWQARRTHLQSQGYNFLAIGYFGSKTTPEVLDRIALEGVYGGIVDASQKQSGVNAAQSCVILIGGSKGAELALLLASQYSDIDGVIAIVPGNAVFAAHTSAMTTSSWAHHRKPFPFVPVPWSATLDFIRGDILAVMERSMRDRTAVANASIPVEQIQGPVYLLSATRDELWPSTRMSDEIVARLQAASFPYPYQHVAIEGDHSEPLNHLDKLDGFLRDIATAKPECSPLPD